MLTFDAEKHEYRRDGIVFPSVTQVIESVAGSRFANITAEDLEFACQRGTVVHTITELHDLGTLDKHSIDPALRGYYAAYIAFLEDCSPKWDKIEHRACDETLGYAGTIDRIGEMNGRGVILDIKTGVKSCWTGVQLAAYANIIKDKKSKRFGLHLGGDGKYQLEQYGYPMDWNVFLSALNIYKFKKEK